MLLDLTNVKNTEFGLLPQGDYLVTCVDAEVKDTKAPGGQYISARFKVESKEFMNRTIFHMFTIKNTNEKAVQIGMQQIKSFLEASSRDASKLEGVSDLMGAKCTAHVKIQTSAEYGDKNVIAYFKKPEASIEADLPF